jgi:glycosyltransferase involved in cell wall biosynthesis
MTKQATEGFFFDARYIRIDNHDGISRFSVGLFSAINQITDVTAIVSDLRQLERLPRGSKFIKVSSPTSLAEPFLAHKLNQLGAKVVFSPMQTMGTIGRKFKVILTVHDLIYYRHPAPPQGFSLAIRVLWRLYHLFYWPQRFLLNGADAIVAVSETTKKLIAEKRLTKRPVHVVHNAADPLGLSIDPGSRSRPTGRQTLIYMGSFMDYKNVEVLVSAMNQLPDYQLHLLSRISSEKRASLMALITDQSRLLFHDGVSEEKYQTVLAEAIALVSGSREEGFGIPLVEAMAIGTPIVVSDIPIFREIGGQAARFFDQDNPASFARTITELESNEAWLKASRESVLQAKKYNWQESAAALLKLIKQI